MEKGETCALLCLVIPVYRIIFRKNKNLKRCPSLLASLSIILKEIISELTLFCKSPFGVLTCPHPSPTVFMWLGQTMIDVFSSCCSLLCPKSLSSCKGKDTYTKIQECFRIWIFQTTAFILAAGFTQYSSPGLMGLGTAGSVCGLSILGKCRTLGNILWTQIKIFYTLCFPKTWEKLDFNFKSAMT